MLAPLFFVRLRAGAPLFLSLLRSPMSFLSRCSAHAWILILLGAFGFIAWSDYGRAQRVDYVTHTDQEEAVIDAASPTGYADGKRWIIVPEHHNRSYQWIAETQQMLAQKEWRVRHIDSENAPYGRDVHSASPYRWWLGLIAWCEHSLTGHPYGLAAERAALWADPLLHLLFLVVTTVFVARQFGALSAGLIALGLATLYPFAGSFLPGVPDDHSLARICALWSVLPLLAAIGRAKRATTSGELIAETPAKKSNRITPPPPISAEIEAAEIAGECRRTQRLFFSAGIAGGLGLWISVANQIPVIAGISAGGFLAAWIGAWRVKNADGAAPAATPWRAWALGGALTCLAAYLVEYFPTQLDLRLQVNHPLYGLAWLGLGELLAQITSWSKTEKSFWNRRRVVAVVLAIAAVAAWPIALILTGTTSPLSGDPLASRLSNLPNGIVAQNFFAWLARDGFTAPLAATGLPLLSIGVAGWILARRPTDAAQRITIALAFGPVLVTLALAFSQLSWWAGCDVACLTLLVAATMARGGAKISPLSRWLWSGFTGVILLPGLILLAPPPMPTTENIQFTRLEVEGLLERSLAHWIADHAGPTGAVVLAPPDRTTSWCFHGGLRGLGTANWENRDGLAATIRLVSATTADEALALLNQRGVTHIVLPSWDSDLDEFARWTLGRADDAFIMAIHRWSLPPWLRPLPYSVPAVAGFEGQSVVILAVTDESNRAAATARLADYFLETQQLELANSATQPLQRYPSDLGALVALAQIEKARGDTVAFTKTFDALVSNLSGGSDRSLAWDRRVSLAILLAQGQRTDLAREQVRRCLEKITAARLRSLTTGSLFRLQMLAKAYEFKITDEPLRALALKLLPAELRSRL